MKVVLTGAAGFLGWHTRLRLHAQGEYTIVPLTRDTWPTLEKLVFDADAVIHIAGVNRAENEHEVRDGNVALAQSIGAAMDTRPGLRVVYANSTQCGNETPYGKGKAEALAVLRAAAERSGGHITDVRLPNLFGEHGRPRYNSFVASFVDASIHGKEPTIRDNTVPLLHAQDAAQALIQALSDDMDQLDLVADEHHVREVWELLTEFRSSYASGDFPDLRSKFRVDLFNTYRAALFPAHYPLYLTPHSDSRGTFVETVRSRGGEGQSSVSTTVPGVTRGEHFHLHKVERFVVVEGQATIALRKMFSPDIVEFHVNGGAPAAIDMPTGWVHNITNTGTDTLITQFWSQDLFRPDSPDTYWEPVRHSGCLEDNT